MSRKSSYMKQGLIALLVTFFFVCCIANMVHALPCDTFYTSSNPILPYDPTPIDPLDPLDPFNPLDPRGWVWPEIYTQGVPPDGTVLPKGDFMIFAHENLYLGPEWFKMVTLEFDYAGFGVPILIDNNFGFYPERGVEGIDDQVISEKAEDGHYELVYRIDPQPDWEWFAIFNDPINDISISNVSFTTECAIPEPATMLLLGTGIAGLAGFRKKFRRG